MNYENNRPKPYKGCSGKDHVARCKRLLTPQEERARVSEREQIEPREWDEGDLSYDDGWCDEPECPVCASVEIRTPRLTCPLLARAA